MDVRPLNEREADRHEHCAEPNLQKRQRLKSNAWRDVSKSDAVERESDGAAKREHVADVDRGEIGQQGGHGVKA